MNKLAFRYNHLLIFAFVFAPFLAFFSDYFLDVSFNRTIQALSYLGVFLMLVLRDKDTRIKFPAYLIFYLLFVLYVYFSTFVLLNRSFKLMYLFSNPLIGGFNMMFIIENLTIPKMKYDKVIRFSKYILVIAFVVILYQQAVDPLFFVRSDGFDEFSEISSDSNRLPSIYSSLGSIAIGFCFIPVFLLVVEVRAKHYRNVIIWIIIGLTVAFLSKARWIMLNSFLVFILVFIINKGRFSRQLKYIFLVPFIMIASYFFLNLVGIDASAIVKNRILESDKQNLSQSSAGTRILAFEAFNRLYWNKPFLGSGNIKYGMGGTGQQEYELRSFLRGRSSQIHVGYLSLFYMYGLVGGTLFLSFLFLLLKKLYKNARQTHIWAPFLGFIGLALANWTLVAFSVFEMGLLIVFYADQYYSQHLKFNEDKSS